MMHLSKAPPLRQVGQVVSWKMRLSVATPLRLVVIMHMSDADDPRPKLLHALRPTARGQPATIAAWRLAQHPPSMSPQNTVSNFGTCSSPLQAGIMQQLMQFLPDILNS
eukprot:1158508-Pelagomonas_calceolata.AAC.42